MYSYSQLSKKIQTSGGEYTFIEKIFNKQLANISGTIMIIAGILCASAVSLGFGNYAQVFIDKLIGFKAPVLFYSFLGICISGIINSSGIKQSTQFSKYNVILILIGLLAMIFKGIGNTSFQQPNSHIPIPKILYSAFLMSFAYWGFGSITKLADETIQPEKVISTAMYNSVLISMGVYALIAFISIKSVGYKALSESKSPLSLVSGALFGKHGFYFMSILGIIAMISTIFILNMSRSRMIHYIAKQYNIPYLSKLQIDTKTPLFSIIFTTLLTILFACMNNIEKLATYANQLWLGVLVLINVGAAKVGETAIQKTIPLLGAIQTCIITIMSVTQTF